MLLGHGATEGLGSTVDPRGGRGNLGQRARFVAKHRLMLWGQFQQHGSLLEFHLSVTQTRVCGSF